MPWPPLIPPNDRTDDTPQLNAHPADHNAIADALTELVARLGGSVALPGSLIVPNGRGLRNEEGDAYLLLDWNGGADTYLRNVRGTIFHDSGVHRFREQGGIDLLRLSWDNAVFQAPLFSVPGTWRIWAPGNNRADIVRTAWELIAGAGDTLALTAPGNSGATVVLAPLGITDGRRMHVSHLRAEVQYLPLQVTSNVPEFGQWGSAPILSMGNGLGNAIAMHVPGLAPQIRVSQSRGEIIDFVNSASNAFISIGSQGFNTGSARRTKRNIRELPDPDALALARAVVPVRYTPAVRPQTVRVDPAKIDTLRAEHHAEQVAHYRELRDDDGNPVPVPSTFPEPDWTADPRAMTAGDHDCTIDGCDADCLTARNDHDRISFIAEDLAEIIPEAVWHDADGPSGFDVGQIAVIALAAVGALSRQVDTLTAELADLRARIPNP